MPNSALYAITELALNYIRGNLICPDKDTSQLRRFRIILQLLSQKTKPLWYKRAVLIKFHGFLKQLVRSFKRQNGDLHDSDSEDGVDPV